MFSLGIEFVTGSAVMTAVATREEAEWPPHPARVFMALVAAHYETRPLLTDDSADQEAWSQERLALEWLEQLEPPSLACQLIGPEQRRSVVKQYVPVNDPSLPRNPAGVKPAEMRDAMGVMPSFRSKQERTFPSIGLGLDGESRFVHLIWSDAAPTPDILRSLGGLVAKVIRIGHSSSLVRVWTEEAASVPLPTMIPRPLRAKGKTLHAYSLRSIGPGLLAELDQLFNATEIDLFFNIGEQIKTGTGKAKSAAKIAFKNYFGEDWKSSTPPPVRRRPVIGFARTYDTVSLREADIARSVFDSELLILTKHEGPVLGLESTNLLMEALRGALLTGSENAPEWFTGHRLLNEPSNRPHIALVPLSFVGDEHADGHLLGAGIAFPRDVSAEERALQLGRLLYDTKGQEREIKLTFGNTLGSWTLRREERSSPPLALRSETWTEPSNAWASVTPVVLDRHPKHDQQKEHDAWRAEVIASIVNSCQHIGLPTPIRVDVDKTSWHRGAPRSRPGPDGMPWLASKSGSSKQQVHVLLEFANVVQGPVLLGSGRYRGYGMCKPLGSSGK